MKKILSNMVFHRKALHQIPELGFQEIKTQAYLIEKIKELGYDVDINVEIADGYPPVINTKTYVNLLKNSVDKINDLEYRELNPYMLAEDFGFYQFFLRKLPPLLGGR